MTMSMLYQGVERASFGFRVLQKQGWTEGKGLVWNNQHDDNENENENENDDDDGDVVVVVVVVGSGRMNVRVCIH